MLNFFEIVIKGAILCKSCLLVLYNSHLVSKKSLDKLYLSLSRALVLAMSNCPILFVTTYSINCDPHTGLFVATNCCDVSPSFFCPRCPTICSSSWMKLFNLAVSISCKLRSFLFCIFKRSAQLHRGRKLEGGKETFPTSLFIVREIMIFLCAYYYRNIYIWQIVIIQIIKIVFDLQTAFNIREVGWDVLRSIFVVFLSSSSKRKMRVTTFKPLDRVGLYVYNIWPYVSSIVLFRSWWWALSQVFQDVVVNISFAFLMQITGSDRMMRAQRGCTSTFVVVSIFFFFCDPINHQCISL